MGEAPLRVRLDLTKLNISTHNFVWFPVARCALNAISDLKVDICKQFNLPLNNIQLFVDGGLMRDEDTVLLLRENDVVQVLFKRGNQEESANEAVELLESSRLCHKKKHKKRKSMNTENFPIEEVDLCDTKDDHISPTPLKKKYKKTKARRESPSYQNENLNDSQYEKESNSHSLPNCGDIGRKLSASIEEIFSKPIKDDMLEVSVSKHSFGNTTSTLTNDTAHISPINCMGLSSDSKVCGLDTSLNSFDQVSPSKKRSKRKRRRKRKPEPFCTASSQPQLPVTTNTPLMSLSTKPLMHLKFSEVKDSSYEFSTPAVLNEKTFSVAENELEISIIKNDDSKKPKEKQKFSTCKETTDSECSFEKKSDCAIDETCTDFDMNCSTSSGKDKKLCVEKSVADHNKNGFHGINVNGLTIPTGSVSATENYSQGDTLHSVPSIGTVIAFKILELSELYCPQISDYKEGKIASVDPKTDDVTLLLRESEIKRNDGKFENVFKNEEVKEDVVQQITVNWLELIEPKLITIK